METTDTPYTYALAMGPCLTAWSLYRPDDCLPALEHCEGF